MAKNFTLIDQTALYDQKVFILVVDGLPGVTQTGIVRNYLGVDDAPVTFTTNTGSQLPISSFSSGDAIVVQYNETDARYELVDMRASTAVESKVVTNGGAVAGYTAENSGDILGNLEPYEIPTGMRVGYGGNGSSGVVDIQKELRFGDGLFLQKRETVEGGSPTNTNIISEGRDAPEDVSFQLGTGYDTAYVASGLFNTVLANIAYATAYSEQIAFVDTACAFNGEDSIITPTVEPPSWTDGDSFLFDIGDDDGDTLLVKLLRGEVFDDGGTLRLRAVGVNVTTLFVNTNNIIAILYPPGDNSFVIGNNTRRPADDEIVLGSFKSGVHLTDGFITGYGTIHTDYDIHSRAGAFFRGAVLANEGFSYDTTFDFEHVHLNSTEFDLKHGTQITLDTPDVVVTGTVDGRDIAADGALLDGLVLKPYASYSADHIITTGQYTVDLTSGSHTFSLPDEADVSVNERFEVINSGAGTLTVDSDSAANINGAATDTLNQYHVRVYAWNGTEWRITS